MNLAQLVQNFSMSSELRIFDAPDVSNAFTSTSNDETTLITFAQAINPQFFNERHHDLMTKFNLSSMKTKLLTAPEFGQLMAYTATHPTGTSSSYFLHNFIKSHGYWVNNGIFYVINDDKLYAIILDSPIIDTRGMQLPSKLSIS